MPRKTTEKPTRLSLAFLSVFLLLGPIHCLKLIDAQEVPTGQNGEPLPTDLPTFVVRVPLEVEDFVVRERESDVGAKPIDVGTLMRLTGLRVERRSVTMGHIDVVEMVILDGPLAGRRVNAYLDLKRGPWFTPDLRPIAKQHMLPRYNPLEQSKESK